MIHTATGGESDMPRPASRAAIYARSATPNAQDGENSLEHQFELCQQHCAGREYTVENHHIYQEVQSGAEYKERSQLTALLEAARNHEFDIVVVAAIDRLSRKQVHAVAIIGELEQQRVRLESVTEPFDDGVFARFRSDILRCMESTARERLRERSARGRRLARQQREQHSSPVIPLPPSHQQSAAGSPLSSQESTNDDANT